MRHSLQRFWDLYTGVTSTDEVVVVEDLPKQAIGNHFKIGQMGKAEVKMKGGIMPVGAVWFEVLTVR